MKIPPLPFLLLCLLLMAISSCTTVRYTQSVVTVTPKKDIVAGKIGNDIVHFNLQSLFNPFHGVADSVFPILTHRTAGNFDAWQKETVSEPEYSGLLPEKSYTDWGKTVKSFVRKYSERFDELIFTIPDMVIAYTEDYSDIEHLKPYPDLVFGSINHEYGRYYDLSIVTFEPNVLNDAYRQRIFRTIKRDYAHHAVVAIDRIYLADSNKVLCLMYICNGINSYVCNADWSRFYESNSTFKQFNPIKNIAMALEFFYLHCDPISVSAFKSLFIRL